VIEAVQPRSGGVFPFSNESVGWLVDFAQVEVSGEGGKVREVNGLECVMITRGGIAPGSE